MVSYTVLPRSIVVGLNGKRYDIQKDDARFEKVLALIREKAAASAEITEDEMKKLIDPEFIFGEEDGVKLVNGVVEVEGEALPSELSLRVIDLKKQNIPIKRLVNFWNNLKENPSMNSVQQLYMFLEHNGHPITDDGCFIAYRSVREDFKDFHTGTMDNSPGQKLSMPRNKVNDKPEETCSHGLHVASWEYAKEFGGGARRMIEVKVNPKDVVCVPNDYNNTKMRVSAFEVLAEVESERREAFVDTSCDDCECDDSCDIDDECEDSYDEDKEQVLELAEDFKDRYSGDALATRIEEETDLDIERIKEILSDEGL